MPTVSAERLKLSCERPTRQARDAASQDTECWRDTGCSERCHVQRTL